MATQNLDLRQVSKIRSWHEEKARALRSEAEQRLKEAEEHEAKIRAYDLLAEDFAAILGSPELPFSPMEHEASPLDAGPSTATGQEGSDSTFIELVRTAVRELPGKPDARFQKVSVEKELQRLQPGIELDSKAVAKALWWMANKSKDKEIKIVRVGSGARPAVYKRIPQQVIAPVNHDETVEGVKEGRHGTLELSH